MEATHHPTLSEVKQWLCDNGYEETVVFENPDYASAFLGVSEDGRAIYDYDLMVQTPMVWSPKWRWSSIRFID